MQTCSVCGWVWDHQFAKCQRCATRSKGYEPSLDEIRAACLVIQSRWTKAVERTRRNVQHQGWDVPRAVRVSDGMVRHEVEKT